jgi:methyl-accepting chemotaxis protein
MKLNRIGNKLGLAGAVSILLSIGLLANQIYTEATTWEVSYRAEHAQMVAEHVLAAQTHLRQVQLNARDIRFARSPADLEKSLAAMRQAATAETNEIDVAYASATKSDTRERLQKLKDLTGRYAGGIEELAKAQQALLAQIDKRTAISDEWNKAFEATLHSPLLAHSEARSEIESLLYRADAKVYSMRAQVWQFGATGDSRLVPQIRVTRGQLEDLLDRTLIKNDNKEFQVVIDSLDAIVKRFIAASDESVQTEALKDDIIQNRAAKFVAEAGELIESAVSVAQLSNKTQKEEVAEKTALASRIGFGVGIAVMVAMIASMLFSFFGVARPMTRLNAALGQMAGGNLDVTIPGADRGDEIGDLAKTVVVIRQNAEHKAHDEADAQVRQDQVVAQRRKAEMVKLADDFEGAVGQIVQTVSSASSQLEASAGTLTSTAERSKQLTIVVATASEEAATNVQSVASATEEMASSINEIGRQVQESARMATEAVDQARKTNERVSELSKAAGRIGDVVELINTIAGQTNLLALNATIEAARAGDAGRGFAVVASEVKALAEQTAKATGEIGQQISGIQVATQESVGAIKEISGTIEKLSEISSSIAAAVEEQGTATSEISRNVQQAAQGTQQVSSNITDVQRGASETGSASSQVLAAARSLSGDSNRLKQELGKFLNSVRAA